MHQYQTELGKETQMKAMHDQRVERAIYQACMRRKVPAWKIPEIVAQIKHMKDPALEYQKEPNDVIDLEVGDSPKSEKKAKKKPSSRRSSIQSRPSSIGSFRPSRRSSKSSKSRKKK